MTSRARETIFRKNMSESQIRLGAHSVEGVGSGRIVRCAPCEHVVRFFPFPFLFFCCSSAFRSEEEQPRATCTKESSKSTTLPS